MPSCTTEVRWLKNPNDLEAYLCETAEHNDRKVEWDRKGISMPVFHSSALELADQYEAVEVYPHHPPCAATCYLTPPLPAGNSGAFDALLKMFTTETAADLALTRAFFLTLVWGGKPGGRPIFAFEAATENGRPGQGSGKSTVVQKAGELLGGYVSIDLASDSGKDIMPRLLSAAGRRARLVLFDNLKGSRVSSSLIESNVTAPVLSGKMLYQGEGSRPNYLTWALTTNQASLSKDLAQRTYPIRVRPPVYSPKWEDAINRHIAENRWAIIGDMIAQLAGPPVATLPDGSWSRWAAWERDVLCRVCDPLTINGIITSRRTDLDDDDSTSAAIRDTLAKWINSERILDAEQFRIKLPPEAVAKALESVSPHGKNLMLTCRWLASINVPSIQKKRTSTERYWLWIGSATTNDDKPHNWNDIPTLPA